MKNCTSGTQLKELLASVDAISEDKPTRTRMGITTYITHCQQRGYEYKPSIPKTVWAAKKKKKASDSGGVRRRKKGLSVGRQVHLHLSRVVSNAPSNPSRNTKMYANRVLDLLATLGIKLVAADVFVSMGHIETKIDLLGFSPNKIVWVVELKTTQNTYDVHKQLYTIPCNPDLRCLATGLPNTVQTHHRLQVSFGMHAFVKRYEMNPKSVRGIVIVCCADKPCFYVERTPLSVEHFTPLPVIAPTKKKKKSKRPAAAAVPYLSVWPVQALAVFEKQQLRHISTSNDGVITCASPKTPVTKAVVLSKKYTVAFRADILRRTRSDTVTVFYPCPAARGYKTVHLRKPRANK